MRKRKEKGPVPDPKTLNPINEEDEEETNRNGNKGKQDGKGFFACYLLTSLCPRYKGHTYIGFTVNPRRRIRQHNGEIGSGACRTKKRRPWEMVLCIYGFPTNVSALQFEWAWQHPTESLAVRQAASTFKSFSGVANKINLAYTMLSLPNWQSLAITVNYFSTKYSIHSATCPSLPRHMNVQVCTMDELPCYSERDEILLEEGDDGLGDEASDNSGSLEDHFIDSSLVEEVDIVGLTQGNDELSWPRSEKLSTATNVDSLIAEDEVDIVGLTQKSNDELSWPRSTMLSTATNVDSLIAEDVVDIVGFTQKSNDEWSSQRSEKLSTTTNVDSLITEDVDVVGFNLKGWQRSKKLSTATINNAKNANTHTNRKPVNRSSNAFEGVEVIDLLTPSPNCRVSLCSKKRRVSSGVTPVIIDLT